MEVKSKLFKRRAGKSAGKWVVRVQYFDEATGQERSIERLASKRTEAVDKRNQLVDDITKSHGQSPTGEKMTFSDLTALALKTFYQPAVLMDGRKIAGVRAHETVMGQINSLNKFFGKRPIRQITKENLTDYKLWRLKTGEEKLRRPLRLSTVNRELSTMRRLMRFALGEGWVQKDIFFNAKVIETSAEIERSRLLTLEEEYRLLAACQGEREVLYERFLRGKKEIIKARHKVDNPHLKAMILLALDSGLRRGEILKLAWNDFDFDKNLIRILGTNTETERERLAPFSERTKVELENLRTLLADERPFNFKSFKRSFSTAIRLAGISNLQFRDLRRTAITRWQERDIPLAVAGKLAGHTQLQTTMKHYTAADARMVSETSEKLNIFHKQNERMQESSMVN
jgi:integrase